jgi:hypothetical protein
MEPLAAGPLFAALLISAVISLATAAHRLGGGSRRRE